MVRVHTDELLNTNYTDIIQTTFNSLLVSYLLILPPKPTQLRNPFSNQNIK